MTTPTKQLPNEDFLTWKLRLLTSKLNREIDLDWSEIRDILGLDCSPCHLRKTAYGIKEYRDYFENKLKEKVESDEILNEFELKKIELESERKKLQSIKVEYNKLIRDNSRRELMFEMIKESIEKLPIPNFNPIPCSPKARERSGILAFGDIHFGKVLKSLHNEYSPEIAKQRMEQLMTEIIEIVDTYQLDHIDIINGADSIEGMSLRISQLQSLSMGFIDQTIQFSKFISSWLNELSEHVKISYHHIPASNHSQIRPFNSSRNEFTSEDLEKVIMNYVHDTLENNDRVNVPLYETDIIKLNIQGYNIWALHGHQLKGKKDAIRDLSNLHRQFVDHLYISHFHHSGTLTVGESKTSNVEVIQVPSVMGSDEYSDSLMTGAKAGAIFDIYENEKGRKITHNIILN